MTTGVAADGSSLSGNFTLSVTALSPGNGNGHYKYGNGPAATDLVTRETAPIPYDATDNKMFDVLMELDNIWDVQVNRTDCEVPELTCTWYITFRANRYTDKVPNNYNNRQGANNVFKF